MATAPPAAPNPITTPRTPEELSALATSQINADIAGQEAPLQSQIGDLGNREKSTLQGIGDMFGTLTPFVGEQADKVQSSYDTAFQASQSIFNTAQQRMAQLKQSRAQEAQAMAQEIGGPVAVGEFTASVLPAEQELASTAPNVLLHQLGEAQNNEQESRAFSEKVFPVLQTEQESQARNFFETQISDINKQIAAIESSKKGATDTRLNDLLVQERSFAQGQAQIALDKVKANHDWQATLRTLHNDDQRLALSQKSFKLSESGVTGTYKGQPTQQAIKTTIAERQTSQRLGLQQAALQERIRKDTETAQVQKARFNNQAQRNAMQILDHAYEPSSKGTLTLTKKYTIDPKTQPGLYTQALLGKLKDAHRDPKTGQWYYYGKQTLTTQQAIAQGYNLGGNQPITDPQDLYNLLTGAGYPPAMSTNLVRQKTGIGDFSPGKATNYTTQSLANMTNKELMGIAKARGYKGGGKRNDLIQYITTRNPATPNG